MTAPTTTNAADRYLAEVEAALADLPGDDRAELLDDLAMHLAAVGAEDDARPLADRLGSSADYAAELRAAAGLPAQGKPAARGSSTTRRLRQRAAALAEQPWARELLDFLPTLRPAWWVARGYLVVLIPSLRSIDGTRDFPVPAPFGSHLVGVALVVAAIVASVALGRRRLPVAASVAVVVANAVLVLLAIGLLDQASWRLAAAGTETRTVSSLTAPEGFPLTSVHGPVTNIYPYAADGTALDGVLLFDQDGRPLRSSVQRWWADSCPRALAPPSAADGVAVPFSYPQRYLADTGAGAASCPAVTPPPVPLPSFAPAEPAAPAASPVASPAASA